MFTKEIEVGSGQWKIFDTVTDWYAIGWIIFFVLFAIVALQTCSA